MRLGGPTGQRPDRPDREIDHVRCGKNMESMWCSLGVLHALDVFTCLVVSTEFTATWKVLVVFHKYRKFGRAGLVVLHALKNTRLFALHGLRCLTILAELGDTKRSMELVNLCEYGDESKSVHGLQALKPCTEILQNTTSTAVGFATLVLVFTPSRRPEPHTFRQVGQGYSAAGRGNRHTRPSSGGHQKKITSSFGGFTSLL